MNRRTYLSSLGAAGIAGAAGCLDAGSALGGDDGAERAEGAVLEPPERSGDPSHPTYGDEVPSFSLPDPLAGEDISSDALEGERAYLMTFIFTSCPDGACPALLLRLRRAHEDAKERGTTDETAFLAMTFDPERDTPEVLEEYADQQGVDLEAGNWHFLRPESDEEAMAVVNDDFGMPIERVDTDEHPATADNGDDSTDGANDSADDAHGDEHAGEDANDSAEHDDHGDHDDADHDDAGERDGNDEHDNTASENDSSRADHDHGEYTFTHYNLILLVNERGIVERAYPQATGVDIEPIVEDFRTVVDG